MHGCEATSHYGWAMVLGKVDPRAGDRVEPLPHDYASEARNKLGKCQRIVRSVVRGLLTFEGADGYAFPPGHFRLIARAKANPEKV